MNLSRYMYIQPRQDLRELAFVFVAFVFALALFGCAKQSAAKHFALHGKVMSVDKLGHNLVIEHDAIPGLSASEAVALYKEFNQAFRLQPGTRAYLGRYTGALNPGFGTRLAWGYASDGCPNHPDRPLSSRCTAWLFLDANTGRMIVGILPARPLGPNNQIRP